MFLIHLQYIMTSWSLVIALCKTISRGHIPNLLHGAAKFCWEFMLQIPFRVKFSMMAKLMNKKNLFCAEDSSPSQNTEKIFPWQLCWSLHMYYFQMNTAKHKHIINSSRFCHVKSHMTLRWPISTKQAMGLRIIQLWLKLVRNTPSKHLHQC